MTTAAGFGGSRRRETARSRVCRLLPFGPAQRAGMEGTVDTTTTPSTTELARPPARRSRQILAGIALAPRLPVDPGHDRHGLGAPGCIQHGSVHRAGDDRRGRAGGHRPARRSDQHAGRRRDRRRGAGRRSPSGGDAAAGGSVDGGRPRGDRPAAPGRPQGPAHPAGAGPHRLVRPRAGHAPAARGIRGRERGRRLRRHRGLPGRRRGPRRAPVDGHPARRHPAARPVQPGGAWRARRAARDRIGRHPA